MAIVKLAILRGIHSYLETVLTRKSSEAINRKKNRFSKWHCRKMRTIFKSCSRISLIFLLLEAVVTE